MSKCVICTFFKMVISGLWNNVCPSVDKKKKEERKENLVKVVKELLQIILIFIGIGILAFFVTEYIDLILKLIPYLCSGLGIILIVVFLFTTLSKWIKETIACIKAYWRKAKEECE